MPGVNKPNKTPPSRLLHRQLCLLSGQQAWCNQTAQNLVAAHTSTNEPSQLNVVWVSSDPTAPSHAITPKQTKNWLGRELTLLVFDGWSGIDADALAAISGALVGGGFMILLTPTGTATESPATGQQENPWFHNRFLARFSKILRASAPRFTVITQENPAAITSQLTPLDLASINSQVNEFSYTDEQQRAMDGINKVATGHRRRPLVITADRGRGKSSALGAAAAQLLQQGKERILITASRLSATDTLFEHARLALPEARVERGKILWQQRIIEYMAPDELIKQKPSADLLIVDEAATLPAPILEALLRQYSRIVFATTVHGYEGTGRGFAIRFSQRLDQLTPQWRTLTLHQPIRWANKDPLEALIFNALLLNALPAAAESLSTSLPAKEQTYRIDRTQPLSESLLSELFGLLITAHYQTKPSDLHQLLDHPQVTIWVSLRAGHVAAVALLIQEGNLDLALAEKMFNGERRPSGQLIPGTLVTASGVTEFGSQLGLRIMRIAVHPALQNKTLGSQLIENIEQQAQVDGFDWLGSSFGATQLLLHFWQKNQFEPLNMGLKQDAASGEHSALVIKPLTRQATVCINKIRFRWIEQLSDLLIRYLNEVDPKLLLTLIQAIEHTEQQVSKPDQLDAAAFAHNQRGFDHACAALTRLLLQRLLTCSVDQLAEPQLLQLGVARLLQNRSWQQTSQLTGLSGKKACVSKLRQLIKQLL